MAKDKFATTAMMRRVAEEAVGKESQAAARARAALLCIRHEKRPRKKKKEKQTLEDFLAKGGTITKVEPFTMGKGTFRSGPRPRGYPG